jgi:hypothetical protein
MSATACGGGSGGGGGDGSGGNSGGGAGSQSSDACREPRAAVEQQTNVADDAQNAYKALKDKTTAVAEDARKKGLAESRKLAQLIVASPTCFEPSAVANAKNLLAQTK